MAKPQAVPPLFSPQFLQDPYPLYRQYLGEAVLHRVEGRSGMWAVFRYAECSSHIRDPGFQRGGAGSCCWRILRSSAPNSRA